METVLTETCKQIIDQLSGFLDGELDPALCEKIQAHLAVCPMCPIVVDTTQKTITLYRDASQQPMPDNVRAHLIEVLGLEPVE